MHHFVIAFERQHVIGIRFDDRVGDLLLRTHRVHRDDAAGQFQHAHQLGQRRDLVALVGHFQLAQHQAVALRPRADDVLDRPPCRQRPAQRLAVQRDDCLGDGLPQALRPAGERVEKFGGIEGGEDAVERVVRGDAVAQAQERLEPILLGVTEFFHVIERLAATEQGADRDDQDADQVMLLGAIDARIGQMVEVFDEVARGMLMVHPDVQSQTRDFRNQNFHRQLPDTGLVTSTSLRFS